MKLSPGCKTSGPGFGLGVQGFMALGIRVLMGFSVLGFCPHPVHVSSWGSRFSRFCIGCFGCLGGWGAGLSHNVGAKRMTLLDPSGPI